MKSYATLNFKLCHLILFLLSDFNIMKFKLDIQNFGKIKRATIQINHLTVLAGQNTNEIKTIY